MEAGLLRLMVGGWLVASLAACSSAPLPPPAPAPSADPAAACLAGLDRRHIVYDRVKDWTTPEGCGISSAVRVKQSAIPWNSTPLMTCQMAATLWDFETKVVQPAAQSLLHQKVRKMVNMGTYSCRGERSEHSERLSQHSFGKAIDVSAFELEDGSRISVLRDWKGQGAKSDFLQRVAKGACEVFNVVMTPNRNELHRDHLHLDIGPHKLCGY